MGVPNPFVATPSIMKSDKSGFSGFSPLIYDNNKVSKANKQPENAF